MWDKMKNAKWFIVYALLSIVIVCLVANLVDAKSDSEVIMRKVSLLESKLDLAYSVEQTYFEKKFEKIPCSNGICELEGDYVTENHRGLSMYPTILDEHDLIGFDFVGDDFVFEEDKIYSYQNGSDFIIHRCVQIVGEDCMMKGDNNELADGIVEREQVVSEAKWLIRKL